MLEQLVIRQFALIDNVSMEPAGGLNLLTGETGAGKTIVTGALGILMGKRASADLIRRGENAASVEGFFSLEPGSIHSRLEELGAEPEDGAVLLRREISRTGKNRCLINGKMVPLSLYSAVGTLLMDIHGQNQEQALLNPARQLELLDNFGGRELWEKKEEVRSAWDAWRKAKEELKELDSSLEEAAREAEYLRFVVEEIGRTDPRPGEDTELELEKRRLSNLESIFQGISGAYESLTGAGGTLETLDGAAGLLEKAARFDGSLEETEKTLRETYWLLEEVARDLRVRATDPDFEEGRLAQVEDRLAALSFLRKKYGGSLEAVLETRQKAADRLALVDDREEELERRRKREDACRQQYLLLAEELGGRRRSAAGELGRRISEILKHLSMPLARLEISLDQDRPGPQGTDRAEFLFAPNPGEGLASLARIASGGEISRVMLAVKVILADADDTGILVFDEVDTGIGGEAIVAVAENLSRLGEMKQVFCVSHSPQLASFADVHFRIEKHFDGSRTTTRVTRLDGESRREEIARMLGGQGNIEGVETQAAQMLRSALAIRQGRRPGGEN